MTIKLHKCDVTCESLYVCGPACPNDRKCSDSCAHQCGELCQVMEECLHFHGIDECRSTCPDPVCPNKLDREDELDHTTGDTWFCDDCASVAVNGEHNPDRPERLPQVLSLIAGDTRIEHVTSGRLNHRHLCLHECDEFCEELYGKNCPDANQVPGVPDEDCDCEDISHSTISCGGCGDSNHGPRTAFTIWFKVERLTSREFSIAMRREAQSGKRKTL